MIHLVATGEDDTSAIQSAVNDDRHVILSGDFLISGGITLSNDQRVETSNATITQTTVNKPIFSATNKNGIVLDLLSSVLIGEGSWSSAWGGNGGLYDHAIQLEACTNVKILHPTIHNCAHAGIAIYGGYGIYIDRPVIEGTHTHGVPLPSQSNFQAGIFIQETVGLGAAGVTVSNADISGVSQGILIETYPGVNYSVRNIDIIAPFIHDIPGQHAFYIQRGNVTITSPIMHDIELSGIKVQSSADNNLHIRNIMVSGARGVGVKSNLIELATLGSGSISNVRVGAVGSTVGTGIAVVGNVNDLKASLTLQNVSAHAALVQGTGADDLDIEVFARTVGQHGVVVQTTSAYNIKIRPTLRNCGAGPTPFQSGVIVSSDTPCVDVINPDITDSAVRMRFGVYSSAQATRIRGYSNIIGAAYSATYGSVV